MPNDFKITHNGFWHGKTVLVRETPVIIVREVYCSPDDPYCEALAENGTYYKIPLDRLKFFRNPVVGYVEPKKVRNGK